MSRRVLAVASGAVFIAFGVGKFVNHGSELASFRTYGLPAPAVFVVLIGVVELVGGVLLVAGRLVRPAALVLAADMVGAITVSGLARGELISLTLAPAQLVAMVALLAAGTNRGLDPPDAPAPAAPGASAGPRSPGPASPGRR